ncbi:MAG: LysR family transcriptional regulator [Methanosarcinales archaeon]|jgi:molybdate transport system regulatory protein|nr:LysR family transcriptional regulator [Methanosarcinales archaeon]
MIPRTKLWLTEDGKTLMGEGKAALLYAIDEEGSLNKACRKVNISYKHAWLMLKNIEKNSGKEIVTSVRGGKDQGTFLTDYAREMLKEYESQKNIISETLDDETFWEGVGLKITARNQMQGEVIDVEQGDVISKVRILIEPVVVTSLVTKEAVDKLDIKKGDEVYAVVKSTEVMIGKK